MSSNPIAMDVYNSTYLICHQFILLDDLFLLQARNQSSRMEVGQGRQLHKYPPWSPLLHPLRGRQGSR